MACCYARQSKLWLTDPDHNLWEIYHLEEDIDHSGFEDPDHRPAVAAAESLAVWEYRLPDPMPERINAADASLDEVRLCGVFNADVDQAVRQKLLDESFRVLKPSGKVVAQGLVSAEPFPGKPDLPGLAAKIQRVPVETEPLDMLQESGFTHVFYDELADIHCFQVEGVELRKLRICGQKPVAMSEPHGEVVYKGHLDEVVDDVGNVFRRGQRTAVDTVR